MMPAIITASPALSRVPTAQPQPDATAAAPVDRTAVDDCLGAISNYLDTPLAIDGIPGIDRPCPAEPLSNLTHLIFYRTHGDRPSTVKLMIHLVRSGKELMMFNLELPKDRNVLFRAVATASHAAHDWDRNTPAANDAQTQVLRQMISGTVRFNKNCRQAKSDLALVRLAFCTENTLPLFCAIPDAGPATEPAAALRHWPGTTFGIMERVCFMNRWPPSATEARQMSHAHQTRPTQPADNTPPIAIRGIKRPLPR